MNEPVPMCHHTDDTNLYAFPGEPDPNFCCDVGVFRYIEYHRADDHDGPLQSAIECVACYANFGCPEEFEKANEGMVIVGRDTDAQS